MSVKLYLPCKPLFTKVDIVLDLVCGQLLLRGLLLLDSKTAEMLTFRAEVVKVHSALYEL